MSTPVPIHQVGQDGEIRFLGDWLGDGRRLELTRAGFPLLAAGSHTVDGEFPWVFWDMCPSGFLGRRLSLIESRLALGADPRTWTAGDALRILTEAGEDLPGNLIVGERSLQRWRELRSKEDEYERDFERFLRGEINVGPGFSRDGATITIGRRPWDPPDQVGWLDAADAAPNGSSSLGGERPKFVRRNRRGGALVKFSPPLGTPQGQRWADLLRVEAHCAATLAHFGVSSAVSNAAAGFTPEREGPAQRVWLTVPRFDRTPGWGRRGAATLYWYAMARYGDVRIQAPIVIRDLVSEGHLAASAAETTQRVHSFSEAIGNNDAHLGNYGLVFDDEGRADLAPIYDVLPMALAPANDELPDSRLRPRTPSTDPVIAHWVHELVSRVEGDAAISDDFKNPWRRHIGV